jgi:hypothetical protein
MSEIDAFKLPTWEERGGEYVRRLVRDADLTAERAAGLVGNLGYESGEFKKLQEIKPLVPGSAGGFGVAQWTGPRRRAFEKWCTENALFPHSDEANYGFLLHELRGDYKTFAARLRQTRSIEDACRLTHKDYETPSDVFDGSYRSGPARLKYAQRALAGAQSAKPTPKPGVRAIDLRRAEQAVVHFAKATKRLQERLTTAGFNPGPADSIWGPRTAAALIAYMRAYPPAGERET